MGTSFVPLKHSWACHHTSLAHLAHASVTRNCKRSASAPGPWASSRHGAGAWGPPGHQAPPADRTPPAGMTPTCVWLCVCVWINVCVVCLCMCVRANLVVCAWAPGCCACVRLCVFVCVCMCVRACVCLWVYMCTCLGVGAWVPVCKCVSEVRRMHQEPSNEAFQQWAKKCHCKTSRYRPWTWAHESYAMVLLGKCMYSARLSLCSRGTWNMFLCPGISQLSMSFLPGIAIRPQTPRPPAFQDAYLRTKNRSYSAPASDWQLWDPSPGCFHRPRPS